MKILLRKLHLFIKLAPFTKTKHNVSVLLDIVH